MVFQEKHSPVVVDQDSLIALKNAVPEMVLKATRKMTYVGTGEARSLFKTRGLDFQEIRPYQPGDDIRQIDWRNTAKYGKPFTKLYMEEKERPVYFVCDMRHTMKFASHGDFKSVVAARVTLFLATLAEHRRDRIHFVLILSDLIKTMTLNQADGGVLAMMSDLIAASAPMGNQVNAVSLEQGLVELERLMKKGAFIFICSDFSDWSQGCVSRLERFSNQADIALLHIYDCLEKQLPEGILPMTDGVKTICVDTQQASIRQAFSASFAQRENALKQASKKYGWDYVPLTTDEDYLMRLAQLNQAVDR